MLDFCRKTRIFLLRVLPMVMSLDKNIAQQKNGGGPYDMCLSWTAISAAGKGSAAFEARLHESARALSRSNGILSATGLQPDRAALQVMLERARLKTATQFQFNVFGRRELNFPEKRQLIDAL